MCKGNQEEKQNNMLENRVKHLLELSQINPLIKLDKQGFKQNIQMARRNYSFIIMAVYQNCYSCNYALSELNVVAKSYRGAAFESTQMFFGVVHIEEVPHIVEMVKFSSVPVLIYVPANGYSFDKIEIEHLGFQAEKMAEWITKKAKLKILIVRPANHAAATIFFVTCIMFIFVMRENGATFSFSYNKKFWGFGVVLFCIFMSSGHMWNYIENPPLVYKNQDDGVVIIHRSRRKQSVFETYIVAILNGAITVGVVLLLEAGNRAKKKLKNSKMYAIVGIFLVAIPSSYLMKLCKLKLEEYPFRLLFE